MDFKSKLNAMFGADKLKDDPRLKPAMARCNELRSDISKVLLANIDKHGETKDTYATISATICGFYSLALSMIDDEDSRSKVHAACLVMADELTAEREKEKTAEKGFPFFSWRGQDSPQA